MSQFRLFNFDDSDFAGKSEGRILRENMRREIRYQATKAESNSLQATWTNGKSSRLAELEANQESSRLNKSQAPQTVALVSCVLLKKAEAAPAESLYISPWFVKASAYAQLISDRWFILSSLHSLLDPKKVIEPYDSTLYSARKPERAAWASRVAKDLISAVPPKSKIIILAGNTYREELIPLLSKKFEIEVPMVGLGIGKQLAFLKQSLKDLENE